MQIENLRYFIALNNYKSINKTGHALNTTPQNVSRILKNLESEMETDLFCRTAEGIILTQEGIVFLQFAKNTVYEFDKIQADIKFKKSYQNQAREITIFSSNDVNEMILNDIIVAFSQQYPYVLINNIIVDWKEGYRKLADTPDMLAFLFYDSTETVPENFELIPAIHCHSVAILSKNHPLANEKQISFKQLAGQKIIILTRNNLYDTGDYEILQRLQFPETQLSIIGSGNLNVCYQMTATGKYIFLGILESFLRQDANILKNLVAIPLINYPIATYALFKPKNSTADSEQNLFSSFVLNYLQKTDFH